MIHRLVVDASVAAQWLLPETTTPIALRVLQEVPELLAPELIYAEVSNALWKRVQRGEITRDEGEEAVNLLKELPLHVTPILPLLSEAWNLAVEYRLTIYDALYLCLSQQQQVPLVTADQRLHSALTSAQEPFAVVWIEHIPDLLADT